MKMLSLILWVTQFGFSVLFPLCAALLLGSWLQNTWGLGSGVIWICGIFGFLISVSTARSCLRAMRREADRNAPTPDPPVAFNDHE